uniref:Lysosomal-associated transmembrane protein 4B n=1 Tax=Plectus sambesii TaxID=2011161 RepID=A0A914WM40_9BILA
MSQVRPRSDPNESKYLCCCGCHVMTGAKIVASIYTVVAVGIIALIDTIALPRIFFLPSQEAYNTHWAFTGLCTLVAILVISSLWFGLIRERQECLVPAIICSIIGLILTIVHTIFGLSVLFLQRISIRNAFNSAVQETIEAGAFFVICVCSFVLQCWFFLIFYNAYHHIKYMRSSSTDGIVHNQQSEQVYIAVPKENPEP